ncbi:FG-GAP repeat protein [Pseudoalteromonas luteoviolacea]|uniref:FG-GAP repeat protein n=1 Tax=Pseudoalteromonas luteoviolacea TaxID=43657 RepID=UPI001F21A91B|nr:FG-GAP repeat protein [Pseudoalteromonas luteoviolacea]MCF6441817.1 FG-GAP repeat protein [Pseudoalteromonas luteoviolacea]
MKSGALLKVLSCLTLLVASQGEANQQKLLPHDGKAEDSFGFSVAIDGKTALVGAFKADTKTIQNAGAAYVYALGSNGWYQQAKLVAEPAFSEDTLGGNVALKNNMAMLGVSRRDSRGKDSGAVVVFEKQGNTWTQKQILTAIDGKAGDVFGQSIALTERFLVIGAPHSDAPHKDSGSAYVYTRENGAWQYQTKLTAKDGAADDLFGISVAIDGNTILVGADLHDEIAQEAGAVYAYEFDGKQWQQQAKLMAKDGGHTDIFGVRVALRGDTALISARRDDIEGVGEDAGSAYIFERTDGKWTQTQKLVAPDAHADDRFARGVTLSNDTALISAMHHDANGSNAGAVYMYKKQGNLWHYTSKIVAKDGKIDDRFGWNLALSNQHAIVAAPHRDDNGNSSGAVYMLDLEGQKPITSSNNADNGAKLN